MTYTRTYTLLATVLILSGCMSKASIVSVSPAYTPAIENPIKNKDATAGIILRQNMAGNVVKYIGSEGGLDYKFEFFIGQDLIRTFPTVIGSVASVKTIKNTDDGRSLDYILDPTIRGTIVGRIKASAAPLYELTLNLESPVIKNGKVLDRIYVTQSSTVDIPAFNNLDTERTELMRQDYESQLTRLYSEFLISLRDILKRLQDR